MKKILAKILAVNLILFFGAIYLYVFWIRPFEQHPDESNIVILIAIIVFHLIVFGGGWILGKILDFITDNL